jgi:hypothetical protein
MANKFVVVVETPEDASPGISGDRSQTCENLSQLFSKIASGTMSGGNVRVLNDATSTRVQFTFLSALNNNDQLSFPGQTFTAKTTPVAASEFLRGVSATADAAAFVVAFNNDTYWSKMYTASSDSGVITLTCNIPGYLGDILDFSESTSGVRIDLSAGLVTEGAETALTFTT